MQHTSLALPSIFLVALSLDAACSDDRSSAGADAQSENDAADAATSPDESVDGSVSADAARPQRFGMLYAGDGIESFADAFVASEEASCTGVLYYIRRDQGEYAGTGRWGSFRTQVPTGQCQKQVQGDCATITCPRPISGDTFFPGVVAFESDATGTYVYSYSNQGGGTSNNTSYPAAGDLLEFRFSEVDPAAPSEITELAFTAETSLPDTLSNFVAPEEAFGHDPGEDLYIEWTYAQPPTTDLPFLITITQEPPSMDSYRTTFCEVRTTSTSITVPGSLLVSDVTEISSSGGFWGIARAFDCPMSLLVKHYYQRSTAPFVQPDE